MKSDNKTSKHSPSMTEKELDNKSKKRPTKKDIRPRSISSSSKSPSPNRAPVNVSPSKVKHKKGQKNTQIKASPTQEKQRGKNTSSLNMDINVPNQFTSASPILHTPAPVSPLPESPPSSPGSNTFDKHNYKREDKINKKYIDDKQKPFLQPSSPSRLSKRSRFHTPKKSIDDVDSNYTAAETVKDDLEDAKGGNFNENSHDRENDLERLLNDDDYYPVQENHKDFIPISKLKNSEYVNFLLLIQVKMIFIESLDIYN